MTSPGFRKAARQHIVVRIQKQNLVSDAASRQILERFGELVQQDTNSDVDSDGAAFEESARPAALRDERFATVDTRRPGPGEIPQWRPSADEFELEHGDRVFIRRAPGYKGVVIWQPEGPFSAGANLMLVLLEAQEENWDEIDLMVRAFQQSTMALRYADVPVIVAPAGLAIGGGCEIPLHADRVQAAAETYIGLVEVGVGLIPAGGGTKEMLARAMDDLPAGADPLPFVRQVFETIGFARVSASAADARRLGFLGELGYELHFPSAAAQHVWDALLEAGAESVGYLELRQVELQVQVHADEARHVFCPLDVAGHPVEMVGGAGEHGG